MTAARGPIEITYQHRGVALHVRTPGRFAMDLAVDILDFFDRRPGTSVKDTGWKHGYGIEVAVRVPIRTRNVVAGLQTDGEEIEIRLVSGPIDEFTNLVDGLRNYLGRVDGDA